MTAAGNGSDGLARHLRAEAPYAGLFGAPDANAAETTPS